MPFPTPVDPGSYTYLCLPVPNDTLYRQALAGVLAELGKPWNWQQTVGEGDEGARQAAEVWRKAVSLSIYTDECGGIVDCSAIANCIENNAATRSLIQQIVTSTTQPQTIGYPGQPMTTTQANTPINPVPDGCDKNEFWAQCAQFVEYFTQAGTDLIEKIEVYSNAVEGAAFIEMAPVLGSIVDEVQIDKFLDFIDWAIEIVGEVYAADLTQTVKDEIACAYFCAGFDDCQLTVERIWQVHNERLGGILVPSSIDSVEDLINAMITLATNPGLAVDSWLAFLAGMAKLASYLGVRGIDQTLAITLKLAMNDANNDWEALCDCAPPAANCHDLINGPIVTTPLNNNSAAYGVQVPGQGYKAGSSQMAFTFAVPSAGFTQFTITWNMPVTGTLNVRNANGTQSAPTGINTSPGNSYTFVKPAGVMTNQIYIGFISTGASWASERITEICWE